MGSDLFPLPSLQDKEQRVENICKAVKIKHFQELRLFSPAMYSYSFFQKTSSSADIILFEFLNTVAVFKVTQNPFQ